MAVFGDPRRESRYTTLASKRAYFSHKSNEQQVTDLRSHNRQISMSAGAIQVSTFLHLRKITSSFIYKASQTGKFHYRPRSRPSRSPSSGS